MSIVEILLIFWMSINVAVPVFSAMRGGYSSISVMFLWFSFREAGLPAVPLAIAITCAGGTPAATLYAGMSWMTVAPAPIVSSLPVATGPIIQVPVPI
ncbi:hypothetical protein MAY82_16510 [Edwardsiella ictaluri]|nr:hypothetical protein [Edwardsiella ictaluri]WFO12608.1 hypothetical protein MAY82_16510 [Edwardsiella ictaluri]